MRDLLNFNTSVLRQYKNSANNTEHLQRKCEKHSECDTF